MIVVSGLEHREQAWVNSPHFLAKHSLVGNSIIVYMIGFLITFFLFPFSFFFQMAIWNGFWLFNLKKINNQKTNLCHFEGYW